MGVECERTEEVAYGKKLGSQWEARHFLKEIVKGIGSSLRKKLGME